MLGAIQVTYMGYRGHVWEETMYHSLRAGMSARGRMSLLRLMEVLYIVISEVFDTILGIQSLLNCASGHRLI